MKRISATQRNRVRPTGQRLARASAIGLVLLTLAGAAQGIGPIRFDEPEFAAGTAVDGLTIHTLNGVSIPPLSFQFTVGARPGDAVVTALGPGVTTFVDDPAVEGSARGALLIDFGVDVSAASFGFALSSGYSLGDLAIVRTATRAGTVVARQVAIAREDGIFAGNRAVISPGQPFRYLEVRFETTAQRFVFDNLAYEPHDDRPRSERLFRDRGASPTGDVDRKGRRVYVWQDGAQVGGVLLGPDQQILRVFALEDAGASGSPAVAFHGEGGFVVAWPRPASAGSGVFVRYYSPLGEPLGQAQVATEQAEQIDLAVASGGQAILVWQHGGVIRGRLLTTRGAPRSAIFDLGEDGSIQLQPRVAASASGAFFVVWSRIELGSTGLGSAGLSSHGLGSHGLGSTRLDTLLDSTTLGLPPLGDTVERMNLDGVSARVSHPVIAPQDIVGQLFDSFGRVRGKPMLISDGNGLSGAPALTSNARGNAVVAWQYLNGDNLEIRARRISRSGELAAAELEANASVGNQFSPAVSINSSGDFAVAWESESVTLPALDGTSRTSVFARSFDASGRASGVEAEVPSLGIGESAFAPDVTIDDDDGVLVAFEKRGPAGEDRGLYTTRLEPEIDSTSCTEGPSTLCLGAGRFEVEVDWKSPQGSSGTGWAHRLTASSGTFWFFHQSNVELIVKVLDGTAINGHFWVFYGAMSNVEYTLLVRDTVTGKSKSYFNPGGRFASVGDTSALPANEWLPTTTALRDPRRHDPRRHNPSVIGSADSAARHPEWLPPDAEVLAACAEAPTVLCLDDGRFAVEIEWRAFDGSVGYGQPMTLSNNTGGFWFFDSTNVEVVVKVLDGRALNGHFWVFYGALSNVFYRMTVTDLATGQVKVYENQSGRFASVGDVTAIASP